MSTESDGVVVSFDADRGFGFIRSPDYNEDVFVHVSTVEGGRASMRPGRRVRFSAEASDQGPRAVRVVPGALGLSPTMAGALAILGPSVAATLGLRFAGVSWPVAWLLAINPMTLLAWAWDKHHAVRDHRRVPEAALLGLAAIGGIIGALIGVFAFHHKNRKPRFLIGLGLIAAAQLGAVALLLFWR